MLKLKLQYRGHLYIYHLIEQCTRCKLVFETGELLEAHSMGQGCEARMDQQVDGMTKKMKEQIQNKSRRQTDGEKWEQIYKILFPNEAVPDPCTFCLSKHLLNGTMLMRDRF